MISSEGRYSQAEWVPSPHFDERPEGMPIELIVVHNISLPPGDFGGGWIDDLFLGRLDPAAHPYFADIAQLRVSAHFLIRRDGSVRQYVGCNDRAWHAGVSCWSGREKCNDFSIGIELEGADDVPFAEPQYASLVALRDALFARYGKLALAGHEEVAPGRKTDPGPYFEWSRVRQA